MKTLLAVMMAALAAPAAHADDAALAQLEETAIAYRSAEGFRDAFTYTANMPDGTQTSGTFRIVIGPDGLKMDAEGTMGIQRADGFYLAYGNSGPYLKIANGASFAESMAAALEGAVNIPIPPQILIHEGGDAGSIGQMFGFNLLQGVEPTGIAQAGDRVLVSFTAANGSLELTIDPETDFVTAMSMHADLGGAAMTASGALAPELLTAADATLPFDPSQRVRVDSVRELMAIGPEVGFEAPELTFQTLDGGTVSLADYRGSPVVIEFWAGWCGNCAISLPKLQKVADWADADGRDVAFIALNSRERADDPVVVSRRWASDLGLSIQMLLDPDNAAANAFRATAFPQVIVLDGSGTVVYAHAGLDQDLETNLRSALEHVSEAAEH